MVSKKDLEINEDPILEKTFEELAQCELDMDKADKEVEKFRINKTKPIYAKRAELFAKIPNLWYIILAQHEDFQEYLSNDDMKYLEFIKEIQVNYLEKTPFSQENDEEDDPTTKFSISFEFESPGDEIPNQKVTKYFNKINDPETGESKVISKPVTDFQWPSSYDKINPNKLKASVNNNASKFTPVQKKNYRLGMKSFFAFFAWTGEKPGKEYRAGEELALLIAEDIYPFATKYYTEALTNGEDGDNDELVTSSDELDISDDEEDEEAEEEGGGEEEPAAKKQKT